MRCNVHDRVSSSARLATPVTACTMWQRKVHSAHSASPNEQQASAAEKIKRGRLAAVCTAAEGDAPAWEAGREGAPIGTKSP